MPSLNNGGRMKALLKALGTILPQCSIQGSQSLHYDADGLSVDVRQIVVVFQAGDDYDNECCAFIPCVYIYQYSASDWKSSTKNEWAFREERFVEF